MRSFVKIKPSWNGKITLSFIDIGQFCLNHELFISLMCLLMQFMKIKFSQKFPDLQYVTLSSNRNYFFANGDFCCLPLETVWKWKQFDTLIMFLKETLKTDVAYYRLVIIFSLLFQWVGCGKSRIQVGLTQTCTLTLPLWLAKLDPRLQTSNALLYAY